MDVREGVTGESSANASHVRGAYDSHSHVGPRRARLFRHECETLHNRRQAESCCYQDRFSHALTPEAGEDQPELVTEVTDQIEDDLSKWDVFASAVDDNENSNMQKMLILADH